MIRTHVALDNFMTILPDINSMTVISCEYKLVLVSFEEIAGDDGSVVNLHMIGVASSSTKCYN